MDSLSIIGATGGFILLHATQIQPKNTTSVIVGNLLGIAVGTLMFWATGFAFSFGPNNYSNLFLSYKPFLLIEASEEDYQMFGKEVLFLMLTLVLGNSGFVSRMRYWLYPFVALFIAGFIYPCARHWTQHSEGWLKDGVEGSHRIYYTDEGGVSSVHVFGGSVALIGTIMLAPRKDRRGKKFPAVGGNLTPLMLTGYILAVVGLIWKNSISNPRVVANCMLACQGGALVAYCFKKTGYIGDASPSKALINGSLAGLVAVSCIPSQYHAYGAFVVGVVGSLSYCVWSALLQLCHVDDPTDSIAVHLGAGLWGAMAGPLFRKDGVLYNGSNKNFQEFGWHVLACIAVFVWSGLCVFIVLILFVCTRVAKYRGKEATEIGLDAYEHKEPAYPDREQYTPESTEHVFDDIFVKDSAYSYDNRASRHIAQSINGYDGDNKRMNGKY